MSEHLIRPDLDVITEDALIVMANRGLVKRAQRDLHSATPPTITQDTDGTLNASWHDGNMTSLAVEQSIAKAQCSCGTTSLCRHRIGLVLGYHHSKRISPQIAPDKWSPSMFTDDDLIRAFSPGTLRAAERHRTAGYTATIRRIDPLTVDLPSSTVRFMVPGRLDFAFSDAEHRAAPVMVILAVWAFRLADAIDPDAAQTTVEIAARPRRHGTPVTAGQELAAELLQVGTINVTNVLAQRLQQASREFDRSNLRWLADTLDDLVVQYDNYRTRHAEFANEHVAALLTELHARSTATGSAQLTHAEILGSGENATTPMSFTRFTALGARVTSQHNTTSASIYVANDAITMVIAKDWPNRCGPTFTGHTVSQQRMVRTTLQTLATSSLVTESAVRHANRRLQLNSGLAKTSALPLGRAWDSLPPHLRHDDFAAVKHEISELPPQFLGPRVEAKFVRVLVVHRVASVSYCAGDQQLIAEIVDTHDNRAHVVSDFRAVVPGALPALSAALDEITRLHKPAHISGVVKLSGGRLIIDPLAVLLDSRTVVLDFAPIGQVEIATEDPIPPDTLLQAILSAQSFLSQIAHCGLHQVRDSRQRHAHFLADELAELGFHQTAAAMAQFAESLLSGSADLMAQRWFNSMIRVLTVLEQF